jgi:UDP-glucose 4-epimerase
VIRIDIELWMRSLRFNVQKIGGQALKNIDGNGPSQRKNGLFCSQFFLYKMVVVVTGGLGFIGNELVRQLKASGGNDISIVDNKNRIAPDTEDIQDVKLYERDLTDHLGLSELFQKLKPEIVFHMAAIHYIPECNDNPERTLRVNVEGTQSVLRAAAAAGTKKIVFASSGAVYADSSGSLEESSAIAPVDVYGWSKLFGEQLCHLNHSLNGTCTVIARLFNNYGPRETNPHIIPEIINQLRRGDVLRLGNISTVRDYIHTTDCAKALMKLAEHANHGISIANVASGAGYTVREIIDIIQSFTGRSIDVQLDDRRLRKFDKQTQVANISLLKSVTGWQPEKSIDDGMVDLLKFEKLI